MKKIKLGPRTLLYPMPAVLVGADVDGRPNFMTAAWCAVACHTPPSLVVAIRPQRYTYAGVVENQVFSINIPSTGQAGTVDFCGINSGRKVNKTALFTCFYGTLDNAPLIEECPVNIECRVSHTLELGSHVLVVGEIVETHISRDCITDDMPDPGKIDPLTYAPGTREYHRLGESVGKAFHIGQKLTP